MKTKLDTRNQFKHFLVSRQCIQKKYFFFAVNVQSLLVWIAALTPLLEVLYTSALLTEKLQHFIMCIVGARRARVSMMEWQIILPLKY
jgi:hypothetical protein